MHILIHDGFLKKLNIIREHVTYVIQRFVKSESLHFTKVRTFVV